MVETKYPGDHTMFSFQYTRSILWSKYSSCWYHRQTPANLAFATLLIQELTEADR